MRIRVSVALLLVCAAPIATPALAQEIPAVEVTPYVAIGTAGASPIGAAVLFPLTPWLGYETDVAYRRGEGDIHALSTNANLLLFLPRMGRFTPYLSGGVGASEYRAPVFTDGRPVGTQKRLAMTVNYGGGLKTAVNDQLDLRTDVRWFNRLGDDGGDVFRVAQGLSFDVVKRGRQERIPRRLPIMFAR